MVLRSLARGYSLGRALRLDHATLPEAGVLCAKLLALLWLVTGQVVYVRADVTAFGGIPLTLLRDLPWFELMVLAQLLAILTIVCSAFVRAGCGALAAIIAILSLIDQPHFSNNRAFCAALLCMLALTNHTSHQTTLRLPRMQAALVYLCAALDKLLDVDWRSGLFLRSFVADACRMGELWSPGWSPGAPLPLTCALSDALQAWTPAALVLAGGVIATELSIAVGYARNARFTAPLAVGFHCLLFLLTGSSFGIFFYAGVVSVVLVIDLQLAPRPFDRAWPYFLLAAALAGPWVRPWHALVWFALVSAFWGYARRKQAT